MVGRTNTGGSGSGGTLTVTGIAGHTVTATKDGKTYTRTFNSSGVAVFKGLSTGTWTLTMTGDGQTATRTVDVNADYAVTITYFSATISITYPANSNCVVANSGGQTVASDTNTGTSAKTWTATVNAKGTYTVTTTATDGSGKTKSTTVSITAEGQVATVTLSYALIVFDNGDQDTEVTGGITKDGYSLQGYNSTNNTQVTIGDTIVLKGVAPGGSTSTDRNGLVGTANIIDISNYTTLRVKGTVTGWASGAAVYIGVNKTKTITRKPLAYVSITKNETNFERTLSLPTGQTELYVFALAARADGTTEKYTTALTLTHISLE